MVDDAGHTAGSDLADPAGDVLDAVVHGDDAEVAEPSLLAAPGGPDDAQPVAERELHEDRTDAAGSAEDDDGRSGRRVESPQDPQGGDAVGDHGLRCRRVDVVGDGDEVRGGEHDLLGPARRSA